MPEIELKPITSTNIDKAGYDEDTQELHIGFKSGGVYAYDSVPQFVYRDFLDAQSKGGYFHAKIKDKYKTRKLK